MNLKLKKCKSCGIEKKLWKGGNCLECHKKANPESFKITNKQSNKDCNKPKAKTAPVKPIKKTPLKKTQKAISKRSEKMIVRQKMYQKCRDKYFLEHPVCEFPGCTSKEIQLHHKKGRQSGNLYKHFMSCCDFHHKYIHEHPKESYKNGWLISRIKSDKES